MNEFRFSKEEVIIEKYCIREIAVLFDLEC